MSDRFLKRGTREDEVRDPRLAALLRAADPSTAGPEPDWDRLRASIVSRGALPLARLRRAPTWWELAAGWGRAAVPIAVAAGLMLVASLVSSSPATEVASLGSSTPTASVQDALEDAIATSEPETDLLPALIQSEGWLLSAAFERQ
jgi:hypothetical protein